ncbi:MAG: SAM-dependent methyltransferase [Bacteroidales bacterium]
MQKTSGTLYLIPSSLGEERLSTVWPEGNTEILNQLRIFIVENLRTARRFLKRAGYTYPIDETTFFVLDKHTSETEQSRFLKPAVEGQAIGLLSEAGCPCIADPGQLIVHQAHDLGIQVKPLTGPSSIMLALMASGMNGQQFQFHGYLPIQKGAREKKIKELEAESQRSGTTQIFMETPFRNNSLADSILRQCKAGTRLCVAADLTMPSEYIHTKSIGNWRKGKMADLHKRPAIFLIHAGNNQS